MILQGMTETSQIYFNGAGICFPIATFTCRIYVRREQSLQQIGALPDINRLQKGHFSVKSGLHESVRVSVNFLKEGTEHFHFARLALLEPALSIKKKCDSDDWKESGTIPLIESTSKNGVHCNTEALTNTIPIREIVAGDALSTLSGSKTSLLLAAIIMRSPFAKVRVLLSSKTEFKFSIQTASTGPSKTIHKLSVFLICVERRQSVENIPSVQSFVATSSLPNI